MILGFKTNFPWGEPTFFHQKILWGTKIHTIREGNRWKAGDIIHMATGVRTVHYNQFNKGMPHLSKVVSIQKIIIDYDSMIRIFIAVDGRRLGEREELSLARNDGFDNAEQLWNWFQKPIEAQLIHWTDFRY